MIRDHPFQFQPQFALFLVWHSLVGKDEFPVSNKGSIVMFGSSFALLLPPSGAPALSSLSSRGQGKIENIAFRSIDIIDVKFKQPWQWRWHPPARHAVAPPFVPLLVSVEHSVCDQLRGLASPKYS